MPIDDVYERIETLMVHKVLADSPPEAKKKVEIDDDILMSWPEKDYLETLGVSVIEEVVADSGRIEVWNESLGYACPTCGAFEGAEGCECASNDAGKDTPV